MAKCFKSSGDLTMHLMLGHSCPIHYENRPILNILKISPPKTEIFQIKNSDIFYISAQNIDYEYSLEPPRRGGSNEYP